MSILFFSFNSFAAATLSPSIVGYSSGLYRATSSAGFTMAAANDAYVSQAIINVGGRAVTMDATMSVAANAATYALAGMRLTPAGIAGTLAATWLLQQGFDYINSQWSVQDQSITGISGNWQGSYFSQVFGTNLCSGILNTCLQSVVSYIRSSNQCGSANNGYCPANVASLACSASSSTSFSCSGYSGGTLNYSAPSVTYSSRPATDSDWAALPSPLPVVSPELPYAPYMPQGVPVSPPTFQQQDVTMGPPYKMPDGSTVQDHATISPAGNGQVTVVPYTMPITDTAGNPVSNPTPTTSPNTPPDPCSTDPNHLGCIDLGNNPTPETIKQVPIDLSTTSFNTFSFSGPSSCPAPASISILGQPISFSYTPICNAMSYFKPIALAVAFFVAGLIVIGQRQSGAS